MILSRIFGICIISIILIIIIFGVISSTKYQHGAAVIQPLDQAKQNKIVLKNTKLYSEIGDFISETLYSKSNKKRTVSECDYICNNLPKCSGYIYDNFNNRCYMTTDPQPVLTDDTTGQYTAYVNTGYSKLIRGTVDQDFIDNAKNTQSEMYSQKACANSCGNNTDCGVSIFKDNQCCNSKCILPISIDDKNHCSLPTFTFYDPQATGHKGICPNGYYSCHTCTTVNDTLGKYDYKNNENNTGSYIQIKNT